MVGGWPHLSAQLTPPPAADGVARTAQSAPAAAQTMYQPQQPSEQQQQQPFQQAQPAGQQPVQPYQQQQPQQQLQVRGQLRAGVKVCVCVVCTLLHMQVIV